jgi:hypothetical protein
MEEPPATCWGLFHVLLLCMVGRVSAGRVTVARVVPPPVPLLPRVPVLVPRLRRRRRRPYVSPMRRDDERSVSSSAPIGAMWCGGRLIGQCPHLREQTVPRSNVVDR